MPTHFLFASLMILIVSLYSPKSHATIVEFQTSEGNFQVNLFDKTTPKTVENFLQYVNEQHFDNTLFHRAIPNFIVQGGSFTFEGEWPITPKVTHSAVINEPVYSNIKGTIAMAKVASDPNSATDQWFFNLVDNANTLDTQNEGFTVFGQVVGDGMIVVEKLLGSSRCQDIPMNNYSSDDCANTTTPGLENFVLLNQVIIVDSSNATEDTLSPVKNTLITEANPNTPTEPNTDNKSSGGGAIFWLLCSSLFLLPIRKSLFNRQ